MYVSDEEEGTATDGSDLIDDLATSHRSYDDSLYDMTSEWYGNYYYPPGVAVPLPRPSPYCDSIYRTRFYGFGGPQRSQPGPSQTPVEVDVSLT